MSAHMSGAPLTIVYQRKTYKFSPLRDLDYGEFEMWAQDRFIQVTKRNIKDLPEADQKILLMNSFEKAALITFSSKEARVLMKSVEGAAFLCYLSLRREHPDMTLDEVRTLCTHPSFIDVAFSTIAELAQPIKTRSKTAKKKLLRSRVKKSTKRCPKNTGGQQKKSAT